MKRNVYIPILQVNQYDISLMNLISIITNLPDDKLYELLNHPNIFLWAGIYSDGDIEEFEVKKNNMVNPSEVNRYIHLVYYNGIESVTVNWDTKDPTTIFLLVHYKYKLIKPYTYPLYKPYCQIERENA